MKKIADFIVDKRYIVMAVVLLIMVICAVLMQKVEINSDMTKYLADDSSMKIGMDLMDEEFAAVDSVQTIRVMFQDLDAAKKAEVLSQLETIEYVDSVDYDSASEDYNKDNYTLYILNTSYAYGSDEELFIETALEKDFKEYDVVYQNDDTSIAPFPAWIIFAALFLLLIILLVMCNSWIEPFLFLGAIGVAVVINSGTNIIMGSISNVTSSIAAILQLSLSMDYSIILMSRYRQENERIADRKMAMKEALVHAFSSITSSSLTTIVGLLALVFMSFKIGVDLGVVLAKGVLISMLCIFSLMPGMILACDKLIRKTTKKVIHIPMNKVAAFSYRFRYILAAVFVILFAGAYFMQGKTDLVYTLATEDPIAEIFPSTNMLVVVYDNADEEKIGNIIDQIEQDANVKQVTGYTNTVGSAYTSAELADTIHDMSSDITLDALLLDILYYDYYADGELPSMTAGEFLKFVSNDVLENEVFSGYLDEEMKEKMDMIEKFADAELLTQPLSAAEMADFFALNPDDTKMLFLYYFIQNGGVSTGSMTLPVFANFVLDEVAADDTYASMFDAETLSKLNMLSTFTNVTKVTTSYSYQKIADMLGMDADTLKLLYIYYYALSDSYTPGKMTLPDFVQFVSKDVVSNPAFAAYFDKAALAQMDTLAQYTNKDTIQKQMTYKKLAKLFGMEESVAQQLFIAYFGSDIEGKTMTLPTFTNFLVTSVLNNENYAGYFDETARAQIITVNQIAALAASGQELTPQQLAQSMGIDESLAEQVFIMYYGGDAAGKTMTLPEFTSFLVTTVFCNEAYAGYFDETVKTQITEVNQIAALAASGQPLTVQQLAQSMGLEESMVQQIFVLYFGSDIDGKTMSPEELVDFILSSSDMASYIDDAAKQQLTYVQTIMNASISGTKYGYVKMAKLLGMDADTMKMLYTYYSSKEAIDSWKLSLQTVVNFLADNSSQMGSAMKSSDLAQLKMAKQIINDSVEGKSYSVKSLSALLGLDEDSATQLYLLYISAHGDTSNWKISVEVFVDFIISDVLTNDSFSEQFDADEKEMLTSGKKLIAAVVSGKEFDASGMNALFSDFSEALDSSTMELLYLYHASIEQGNPEWTLTIRELVEYLSDKILNDPRFAKVIDEDMRTGVQDMKTQLDEAVAQLKGPDYSRFILNSIYPEESAETTAFFDKLTAMCKEQLTGNYYLVGNSAMSYEMQQTFDEELLFITLLTSIAIFVVVALTFRSFMIPAILVLIVQCGVYITVSVVGLQGYSIYYLALLIVECILMGATIDYGILFANYYREKRMGLDIRKALLESYNASIHTILTSGLILILVTGIIGYCVSDPTIGQICRTISTGALSATLLILFVLPGLLSTFDRLIIKKEK